VHRSFRGYWEAVEPFKDLIGGFCPDEGFGVPVMIGDVAPDGVVEVGDGFADAAPNAPPRDGGEEAPSTAFSLDADVGVK